jgi:hypothetical protein
LDATRAGSKWPDYVIAAVAYLNYTKIYTHFIPFKETPGHPSIEEQLAMAESLIGFIEANIEW